MQSLRVELGGRAYPIHIGTGLLGRGELVAPYVTGDKAALVTNTTVAPLYLQAFAHALSGRGIKTVEVIVPDGEAYKSWDTLNAVYDRLLEQRCDRQTTLIALGGGVIGDLAGFAAATYQRGVPYIQVPTTLLAQVDSSVGGKTAINHPRGKNMIGAFYQPLAVLADMDTLNTLPERELRAGLAEVIKYGLIRDAGFFDWLEANIERLLGRDPEALAHAVRRSCEIKAEVVARDEFEKAERALLNFGHTFGHAIENAKGYGVWLHGEAVAAGMVMAADLSHRLGAIAGADRARAIELIRRAGLPTRVDGISAQRFIELMSLDKKVIGTRMRFVLLERLGSAVLRDDVPQAALDATLAVDR